jgi:probable F420-dependent oxidoreductase
MEIGVSIPRLPDPEGIKTFAIKAEKLGFESIMAGDHILLPTDGTDQYPYTEDGRFQRPVDEPFLETMTLLAFISALTKTIKIGSTVLILPYRNPIVQAKMFASLDVLSEGRMICGVGVGWLEKEFDTLNVAYKDRGPLTDEYLAIFRCLWEEENPEFNGPNFQINGIQFYPKPVQPGGIPIWVGGHTRRALRRTVKYGNCWHTTRQTPEFVAKNIPYLKEQAEIAGRDPSEITVSLKRTLHFTDIPGRNWGTGIPTGGLVVGTTEDVVNDVLKCKELGIDQLTYDFKVDGLEPQIEVMEHLAKYVLPAAIA